MVNLNNTRLDIYMSININDGILIGAKNLQ